MSSLVSYYLVVILIDIIRIVAFASKHAVNNDDDQRHLQNYLNKLVK